MATIETLHISGRCYPDLGYLSPAPSQTCHPHPNAAYPYLLRLPTTSLPLSLAVSSPSLYLSLSSSCSPSLQRDHILSLLLKDGKEDAGVIEAYMVGKVEEMLCEDPSMSSQLSCHMNFYQERNCPLLEDKPPIYLIPPLPEYQIPIPWPESLHKIWHNNMPYNKLVERNGHQGWMKEEGQYFIFPGGGIIFWIDITFRYR